MTPSISSTPSAATSGTAITLAQGESIQVYTDIDLVAGEFVWLQFSYDGGTNFKRIVGEGVVLDSNHNRMPVVGPGTFKLEKSVTISAKAVLYDQ